MILKKLSILNYKNIRETTLDLSPKMNCFIGHNGAGKTNILDAVYYLSFCRSLSNPIDSQVICHDEQFCVLDATYEDEDTHEEKIYCGLKRGVKKHFKRNKKEYKKLSEHIGLIPLVVVAPSDTMLIEGGSEDRRKLMDVVIAQYDYNYIKLLTDYNTALQQRNTLLKQSEPGPDPTLLQIWEEKMAACGDLIFQKRDAFIQELQPIFQKYYEMISSGREQVELTYSSHGRRGPLLETIQRARDKDLIMGYSLHGVHRDDLEFTIGGKMMKREGSQGQNKTYVIAIKLAQFELLRRTISRTRPILLLDDIFDKLDSERVEQIVKLVSSDTFGQIFVTDTNRSHLDRIVRNSSADYKMFEVNDGNLTQLS